MSENIDRSDELLAWYAEDQRREEASRDGRDPDDCGPQQEPEDVNGHHAGEPVIYPPPTAPLAVARQLYAGCRDADGIRTLLCWRGGWMLWRTTHWSEVDNAEVRARIYQALENAVYMHISHHVPELRPWEPTRHKVANVMEAMAAIGHLSSEIDAPAWIDAHSVKAPAAQVISCENGLLDLDSRTRHDHSPSLFNLVHVPFAYDPHAPEPTLWLDFLASIWDDDKDSIALLQSTSATCYRDVWSSRSWWR